MRKEKIIEALGIAIEGLIIISAGLGFRPLLEAIFGYGEAVAQIGRDGGAVLAAFVLMCIKGIHEDERELDRLRELEKKIREDRD